MVVNDKVSFRRVRIPTKLCLRKSAALELGQEERKSISQSLLCIGRQVVSLRSQGRSRVLRRLGSMCCLEAIAMSCDLQNVVVFRWWESEPASAQVDHDWIPSHLVSFLGGELHVTYRLSSREKSISSFDEMRCPSSSSHDDRVSFQDFSIGCSYSSYFFTIAALGRDELDNGTILAYQKRDTSFLA